MIPSLTYFHSILHHFMVIIIHTHDSISIDISIQVFTILSISILFLFLLLFLLIPTSVFPSITFIRILEYANLGQALFHITLSTFIHT